MIRRGAGHVTLRPATPADVGRLRRWDADPDVAASGGGDGGLDWEAEVPRSLDWREILMAEVDGRPIGVMVIIDPAREETGYWAPVPPDLRAIDIWIGSSADRGRGHGAAMMRQALDRCFADSAVVAVLVDPLAGNAGARRFYERLGFTLVEERRFGSDECAVYRFERPESAGKASASTADTADRKSLTP